MSIVAIHYHRPLHGTTVFRQRLLHRGDGCAITFMRHAELHAPVRAFDRVILEPGAPVVWFTFDNAWHDIGRFHTADGRFTGCYANILTPVHQRSALEWETTDLCLDVWLDEQGAATLLDEAELADAVSAGAIAPAQAEAARAEAARLLYAAAAGTWPPPIVAEWPLARALAAT
jgi:predicted RNA-binding protein associated with RNAse of E/G family